MNIKGIGMPSEGVQGKEPEKELPELPSEVWLNIFSKLKNDPEALKKLAHSDRNFRTLAMDHTLPLQTMFIKKAFWAWALSPKDENSAKDYLNKAAENEIKELDLSGLKLSDEMTDFIVKKFNKIKKLNLGRAQVTPEQRVKLQGLQNLTEINLEGHNIGDEGAKALANMLQQSETLKTLYLANNSIGDDGATALGKMLKGNTALTSLDLERNKIRVEGAKALAEGV